MPDRARSSPPGEPDPSRDDAPDPTFWGADDHVTRRGRHRPPRPERPRATDLTRGGRTVLAVAAALGLVAALTSLRGTDPAPSNDPTPTTAATRVLPRRASRVVVEVSGAVTHPGVVSLPAGSRIVDALDAVGGALAAADLTRLDLAARVRDGQEIVVPTTATSTTTTTAVAGLGPPPS